MIRKVRLDEFEILSIISQKIYVQTFNYLWMNEDSSWYLDFAYAPEKLKTELSATNSAFYFYEIKNQIVGYIKLNLKVEVDWSSTLQTELERIYLDEKLQKQGIGKEMLNFAIQIANEQGSNHLFLKAMDSSIEPIQFYLRNNFTEIGIFRLTMEAMKPEYRGMKILSLAI